MEHLTMFRGILRLTKLLLKQHYNQKMLSLGLRAIFEQRKLCIKIDHINIFLGLDWESGAGLFEKLIWRKNFTEKSRFWEKNIQR